MWSISHVGGKSHCAFKAVESMVRVSGRGWKAAIRLSKAYHTCSIGFRSGDLAGHSTL